jgi:hypothetical protein
MTVVDISKLCPICRARVFECTCTKDDVFFAIERADNQAEVNELLDVLCRVSQRASYFAFVEWALDAAVRVFIAVAAIFVLFRVMEFFLSP